MENGRDTRHFDAEGQRRQKRLFVGLMIGFAVVAALAGVLLAMWIWDPIAEPHVPPPARPPDEHEPFDERVFDPPDEIEEPPPAKVVNTLKAQLSRGDIDRGMAKLRGALDECARKHGAIDGTRLVVDFSVNGDGRVDSSLARPPYATSTPLGSCVATAIRTKGRFRRSREGLRDISRNVTLHRKELL